MGQRDLPQRSYDAGTENDGGLFDAFIEALQGGHIVPMT